jgi:adenylate cyclase
MTALRPLGGGRHRFGRGVQAITLTAALYPAFRTYRADVYPIFIWEELDTMEANTAALTAAQLAGLAGTTPAEVDRMVELGILVPRDGTAPFLATDAQKLRLAAACEAAGLPMDGIAAAIRAGRLSFSFLEAAPYRRWALRSPLTYRAVSAQADVPLSVLLGVLEAMGFARAAPDDHIREDELEIVPLLRLGLRSGILDERWTARVGRAFAEAMRLAARAENEVYHERFELPMLAAGKGQREAMETASALSGEFNPLVDHTMLAIFRRQQELAWTEHLVEHIETALEETGVRVRPGRVPAMCFLDLTGYTRLTEERGDQAAAELAESMAVMVDRSSREHGGVPVKWLGDGVMVYFRDPPGAVLSALALVAELPQAGLPPAHVGVDAGPIVAQGGDYFGRTVNTAARIAGQAGAGQVLVSQRVAEAGPPGGVAYVERGEVRLKGLASPVRLLEARQA